MTVALIDAGPIVALFDPRSRAHHHYLEVLADDDDPIRLHTTWPCIAEAAHFLSAPRRWAMLEWVAEGGVMVYPFDASELFEMLPVMQRYTEPPRTDVDLADASLLWVAAETGTTTILTIDVRDFSRYRLPDGRAFEVL
jgi:uncharacterized protein